MKRIVIISNKHGIYELPHELPNDLRFRILGNIKKIPNLRMKKNFPFLDALDHFVFLYISNECVRRRLPYIVKDDSSEEI